MVRSSVFLSKGLKEIIIMTIIIIIWLFDLEVDSDVFLSIFHARSVFFYFHTDGKAVVINTHSSLRLVSSVNTRRGSLVIWLDDKYLFKSKKYILKKKTKQNRVNLRLVICTPII